MDYIGIAKRVMQCFPGETQQSVAERLGISQKLVSGWVNGRSRPTLESLEVVVQRCKVSWCWLLTGHVGDDHATEGEAMPGVMLEPSQTAILQASADGVRSGVAEAITILNQVVEDQKLANRAYLDADWSRRKFREFQQKIRSGDDPAEPETGPELVRKSPDTDSSS